MNAVKIGQVWKDKDKRRNTVIEITKLVDNYAQALVVGTEDERSYDTDRLLKRWEMVKDVPTDKIETTEKITRELWLEKAVDKLRTAVFGEYDVPTVRVSVGWPGGRGPKSNTIGQCWSSEVATDKISQIFISPVLADPIKVLETLVHEIIHAIDNTESGHRGLFKRIAREVGLEGKLTATHAGDELRDRLTAVSDELGDYPHAAIEIADRPKVQKTYMLKVQCPEDNEFFVRMTQTKIDEYGYPVCPCHGLEMEEA